MMKDYIKTLPQYFIPQHALSRLIGFFTRCKQPFLKNFLIDWFIRRYHVDMSIAAEPDPHQFINFNNFFTRHLRKGVRPIVSGANQLACPVDGIVSQAGHIEGDTIFQAKGFNFSVTELLGGSSERSSPFLGGQFATLYLAPKDYHRIHMPITGTLKEMVYIPGQLFSVNPRTTRTVENLFARNERVVAIFDTEIGPVALVLVGAMIVASINTVWHGEVSPKHRNQVQVWKYSQSEKSKIKLNKGTEMGLFKLGSTVITLFPPNSIQLSENIKPNNNILLGELFAEKI